jgi:hypothetical protein
MDFDEQRQIKTDMTGERNAKLIGQAKIDLKGLENRLTEIANVS